MILGSKVYTESSRKKIEFFNESILMLAMYTFLCYSPWVPDAAFKFKIGYATICIVSSHLVVNFFLIFRASY